ncbi:MAG: hypothetical protein G01um101420_441 [Parcubacteria group bacterium Gr01-1014_20]|nr:MAG: hypothetical protein G01um101420_441 [Parcubacteria group bacterium Gr01-1014_20]
MDLMSAVFTAASVTAKMTRPVEAEGLDGVMVVLGGVGVAFGCSSSIVTAPVLVDSWGSWSNPGFSGRLIKDRPNKKMTTITSPPIIRLFLFMGIL